jgi:hypothetical protein
MRLFRSLAGAVVALGLAASLAPGATVRAADISDLAPFYNGRVHHNTNPVKEDEPVVIAIDDIQGSKFTGTIFGEVPISGKVTSSGKVTFSGKATGKGGGTYQLKKGRGQLSATGDFIVGSFQVVDGIDDNSGNYTFHVERFIPCMKVGDED